MPSAHHNNDRDRVLDATDIVRVVGDHVNLKSKGREFLGLCPFHDDSRPSMYVVPQKQIYHCFACGAGGNALDFVMKYHAMGFREALQHLADRAGLTLTPFKPSRDRADAAPGEASVDDADHGCTREELVGACRFASDFFRAILEHPEHGKAAREAVGRRGISPEMAAQFQIGAAPDRWDGLVLTAQSRGVPARALIEAGLIKARESSGGHFDMFRHRLMFPICDQIGRPIGFGGRKLRDEDEPKYLNSPETRLFDKGATLFGLNLAFRAIQEKRTAIVTEGYTDVIACHQAGIRNVVAALGTAFTPRHAAVLKRMCDTVVLLFDGDEAGQKAADRALEVFMREPLDVRIVVLPGGADPDELLKGEGIHGLADDAARAEGRRRFEHALAGGVDALEYRFARLNERLEREGRTPGSAGRAKAIDEEISRLIELGLAELSPVRRRMIVQRIARAARIDEAPVIEAVMQASRTQRNRAGRAAAIGNSSDGPQNPPVSTPRTAREHALGCLLLEPHLSQKSPAEARDIVDERVYSSAPLRSIAKALVGIIEDAIHARPADADRALREIDEPEARRAAVALAAEVHRLTDNSAQRLAEHWASCLRRLRVERAGALAAAQPSDSVLQRLESHRQLHRTVGGNPLAMPRPGGEGSPPR